MAHWAAATSARETYDDCARAREAVLATTHTRYAPWTIVDFNESHESYGLLEPIAPYRV